MLPANTTFVSATGSGTLDVNTVRWNLGTKTPADSGFVTLTVKVNSPLDKGTIIANTGNICGLGAIADGEPFFSNGEDLRRQKCDDDPATTTVNAEPLLGIAKVTNPTTVGGNQNVTYTVTWSVAGNSKATNVVVTDPYPGQHNLRVYGLRHHNRHLHHEYNWHTCDLHNLEPRNTAPR